MQASHTPFGLQATGFVSFLNARIGATLRRVHQPAASGYKRKPHTSCVHACSAAQAAISCARAPLPLAPQTSSVELAAGSEDQLGASKP